MKYIRYALLIFLFFFLFNTQVEAYGVSCNYNLYDAVSPTTTIATIHINYDGTGEPMLTFEKKTNVVYFFPPTGVALNNIKNSSDGTLTCPPLYWKYQSRMMGVYYYVYFNEADSMTDNPDKYGVLQPTSDSKIDNSGGSSTAEEYDELSCSYKNSNASYKSFSFTIQKNKQTGEIKISNIASRSVSQYDNPTFEFRNFEYKCPSYLNISSRSWGNQRDFYVDPSDSVTEWIHEGEANYADENAATAIYLAYNSPKATKILIMPDGGSYKAVKDGITINLSISSTDFSNGNYPRYIVETSDGYKFSDTRVNDAKTLYMESGQINKVVLGGEEEVIKTCEDLFGTSFLTFLKENVFKIIYIAVPILLIVLTTIDFAKVVFVDDKEGIKKAGKRFGQRVIVAILVYLAPTILIFISNLLGTSEVDDCIKYFNQVNQLYSDS